MWAVIVDCDNNTKVHIYDEFIDALNAFNEAVKIGLDVDGEPEPEIEKWPGWSKLLPEPIKQVLNDFEPIMGVMLRYENSYMDVVLAHVERIPEDIPDGMELHILRKYAVRWMELREAVVLAESEEEAKKMAGRAESDIIDVYDVEVREY